MAKNIHIKFVGTLSHFDVYYTGGLGGSAQTPVATGVEVVLDLETLVSPNLANSRSMQFKIVPRSGCALTAVTRAPTPPYNSYMGGRDWSFVKLSSLYQCDVTMETASDILYTVTVTSTGPAPEPAPEPTTKVNIQFNGNLEHFDVVYNGGLTGSDLKPVATGVPVSIDLAGKVTPAGSPADNSRYLDFRIVPRAGCTVVSATATPTPPFNSVTGSRNWSWSKGSLTYLQSSITFETASDTLYTMTVVSTGPTPSVSSPFNKLFSLTRSKMDELSNKMLGLWGSKADGSPANGGFLINLLLLPFKTPTAVIGDVQSIKIGAYDTTVQAPIINDDSIDVDLGNIVVGGLAGNVMDYAAATYELVLPFFGDTLELEPHQVIGKTINARYDLDAYTGEATANIFNDNSGVPIASANDRVARDIPFKMFSEIQNKLSEAVQTNNGVLQAYIRVTRQDVAGGQFDNLVLVNGVIGSGAGYIEVENADLRGVPNTAQVMNLLQQGVIIR